MSYNCQWEEDFLVVSIHDAVTGNRYALGPKLTEEERQAARDKRNSQTPQENLRDLMRGHYLSQWQASDLYSWFEQHCPGYQFKGLFQKTVKIKFAELDHAMLFKLTWT
jgi:hypothetical protein